jgi:hypothetical protein
MVSSKHISVMFFYVKINAKRKKKREGKKVKDRKKEIRIVRLAEKGRKG